LSVVGKSSAAVHGFTGLTPSDTGQEIDLAVDGDGDPLTANPAGDVLAVAAAVLWVGRSAARTS
jgi:hypothetical protein